MGCFEGEVAFWQFDDPRICGLGVWFEEIFSLRKNSDGIAETIRRRAEGVRSSGVRALVTRLAGCVPQVVAVCGGKGYLRMDCPRFVKAKSGVTVDLSGWCGIAAPDVAEEVAAAVRRQGLEGVPGLMEFYQCLNSSTLTSGDWTDVRALHRLNDYFDAQYADVRLPVHDVEVYRQEIQAFRDSVTIAPEPAGFLRMDEWFVLNQANKDFLLLNEKGELGWYAEFKAVYMLPMTFEAFLEAYARIMPRDGGEFLYAYCGGDE